MGGVCVLRDARDIVGLLCGHYLRIGFDRVSFVDDGSTDGTFEFLCAVSRRDPRVSVSRVDRPTFDQPALMTNGANALIAEGCRIVIPFDADEFWNVTAGELRQRYRKRKEICFNGDHVNFVQRRSRINPSRTGPLQAVYRAPALSAADADSIADFRYPFVCMPDRKVGFKTARPVVIERGQHYLLSGPKKVDPVAFEIFHLPLRSRSELLKRALDYEPRRAPMRADRAQSWQSRFFRDEVLADRVDDVWRTNSVGGEAYLDCRGTRIQLIRDRRLLFALLSSSAYMIARFGRLKTTPQPAVPRGGQARA